MFSCHSFTRSRAKPLYVTLHFSISFDTNHYQNSVVTALYSAKLITFSHFNITPPTSLLQQFDKDRYFPHLFMPPSSTLLHFIPALYANLRYFHDLPFLSRHPGYFKLITQLNHAQESLLNASLLCNLKPPYSTLNNSFSSYCGPGFFLL